MALSSLPGMRYLHQNEDEERDPLEELRKMYAAMNVPATGVFAERLKALNAQEPQGPLRPDMQASRLDNRGLDNRTALQISNNANRSFQERFNALSGGEPELVTQAEKNIDAVFGPKKRLAQRNIRAQEGRIPGYMPGLEADEQKRVSDTLLRSARGGIVDETSPLNNRAGTYNELAGREAAKKAEQDRKMSERFRALQATRDPNAKVIETFDVGRSDGSAGKVPSSMVRTYAERIAGVEDDPETPVDESLRYRAEWYSPEGLASLKESSQARAKEAKAARKEKQQSGRDAVMAGKLAAMSGTPPEATGDAAMDRIARQSFMRAMQQGGGPRSQMDDFRSAMQQAMAFDIANQGKTNLAAMTMGSMGDYKTQELAGLQKGVAAGGEPSRDPQDVERAELAANIIQAQLEALPPDDPRRNKLMDDLDRVRNRLFMPTNTQQGTALPGPGAPAAGANGGGNDKAAATSAVQQEVNPQRAATLIVEAYKKGTYDKQEALSQAEAKGNLDVVQIVKALIDKHDRQETKRVFPGTWDETYVPMM